MYKNQFKTYANISRTKHSNPQKTGNRELLGQGNCTMYCNSPIPTIFKTMGSRIVQNMLADLPSTLTMKKIPHYLLHVHPAQHQSRIHASPHKQSSRPCAIKTKLS